MVSKHWHWLGSILATFRGFGLVLWAWIGRSVNWGFIPIGYCGMPQEGKPVDFVVEKTADFSQFFFSAPDSWWTCLKWSPKLWRFPLKQIGQFRPCLKDMLTQWSVKRNSTLFLLSLIIFIPFSLPTALRWNHDETTMKRWWNQV